MRDIKFRAWLTDRKEMIDLTNGGEVSLEFNPHGLISLYLGKYEQTFLLSEFELLSYTGLKDKNGVEIYEGDIVKFQRITTELVNHPKVFATTEQEAIYQGPIEWGDYGWKPFTYSGIDKDSFEVIGNIYENPELLK